jgi:hypothetical protein
MVIQADKKYMNNSIVAKNWRQQTNKAKNGSSMYYEGRTIYSYGPHFPMAYITDSTYGGKTIILQNSNTYSNSTAKHLNHMRSQCFNDAIVTIPTDLLKRFIDHLAHSEYSIILDLKIELATVIHNRIKESEAKLKRARTTQELHKHDIASAKEEIQVLSCI